MVQAAQVAPVTRTQRHASPERWLRALQRALFAGVDVKQLAGSGFSNLLLQQRQSR